MSGPCLHEKDWGKLASDLSTSLRRIDEMRTDVAELRAETRYEMEKLKNQNLAIERLNINLENLIREVTAANAEHRTRLDLAEAELDTIKHAEGEYLKALKRRSVEEVTSLIMKMIASAVIGAIVGLVIATNVGG